MPLFCISFVHSWGANSGNGPTVSVLSMFYHYNNILFSVRLQNTDKIRRHGLSDVYLNILNLYLYIRYNME